MPTYRTCDSDVNDLLREVLKAHHADLVEVDVTITTVYAHAKRNDDGEAAAPALKHHGYPALAVVKINSVKDRVEGKTDVSITLDGDRWPDLSLEEQTALLDHELTHLVLSRDEQGAVQLDDCNRPKLTMRQHDMEIGAFYEIVERHGDASPELQAYRVLRDNVSQALSTES